MAAELRWILLALGAVLIAGIWWWAARRGGQAPGNAELRESAAGRMPEMAASVDTIRPHPEPRDWGVPPFEPLNIHTAEFDRVPVLDGPMMVHIDREPHGSAGLAMSSTPAAPATPAPGAPDRDTDRFAAAASTAPNGVDEQKIVTVRVCAAGETLWPGAQLMGALELHGLAFGRYQVFHRKHADGRSLFCVASLIEPGTFDVAAMPDQEFRGLTLFAILPGPKPAPETIDQLLATASGLAEELAGTVQDAKGMPLSPQRAAALREDAARFAARVPRHTPAGG